MKKYILITVLALISSTSCYARHPHRHYPPRPYRTKVVVSTPAPQKVYNHVSSRDRMEMAIAYLRSNKTITVKKYAKLTGLSKETAKAELDAFALDLNVPIALAKQGKKKGVCTRRLIGDICI